MRKISNKIAMRLAALVPVALFAVIAIGFGLGLHNDPSHLPSVLIGKPLPAFALGPVRDKDQGFSRKDVEGRVAVINIFASWCSVCRVEHPVLMDLTARRRVPVYGVAWKDKPANAMGWLSELGDPYLRVGDDSSGRLGLDLGVTGTPETFVIDRTGRIRFKQAGPITPEVWRETIAPLIQQLEAEPSS